MSILSEIASAAEKLSTEELVQLEHSLHQIYRDRGVALIYDDSYGTVSEEQLIAEADSAFLAYDRAEAES